ncbi:MAG: type I DNA topoisomerase [Lachnospiraceae bacterium]|nr:type I DNA topoisomerase [Lachnospiraceae bacterium]
MAKNLVIVESPAKAKTIKKFLGTNYEVIASNGHVRDLPKSQMGIDVDHDFEVKYITIRGKGDLLAELRKAVKKADKVYLATDPDREGEAISWHLTTALNLEGKNYKRITFNEITKNAVKNAMKEAREIDMNLVDAQQARRVLDRLVGYSISPILWEKIKRGLSAGRVQSVALRLVCDRENEINDFIPEEYFTLDVDLKAEGQTKKIPARYSKDIKSQKQLDALLNKIKKESFVVKEVKESQRISKSPNPFTTSTLQQEASKKLNFSTSKTMRLAQQLYEGVDVKGHGTIGLITYLRTDSVRVSEEAVAATRSFIEEHYGIKYVNSEKTKTNSGKRIQDAHEAIRPTNIAITPVIVKDSLPRDLFRLYQLIYNRFLASQMAYAVYDTISVKLEAADEKFTSASSKLHFDGYLSVYKNDDEKEETLPLHGLKKDDVLTLSEIHDKQHYTQPPAHFTEASLVKTMEELGIGRPSTYAPTITTIMNRRYIVKEQKNLYVTELGEAVNQMMVKAFPEIVDVDFTANMESLLDSVEEGNIQWKTIIENFYPDLDTAVKSAEKELESVKIADEVSDVICDQCGRNMVIKYGPHGKFLACPGFPECRNTKPYLEKIGVACPKCGKDIVIRKTKKGRRYYGCEDNPNCDFMVWQKPVDVKCPKCGGIMVEKGNKLVCSDESCGHVMNKTEK